MKNKNSKNGQSPKSPNPGANPPVAETGPFAAHAADLTAPMAPTPPAEIPTLETPVATAPTPEPPKEPEAPEPLDADGNPLYEGLLKRVKTNLAQIWAYAKAGVKLVNAVVKAEEAFNGCKKFQGKVMASIQVAYTSDREAKRITPDMSFEKYYEANVGEKPDGRLQALGRLFNRMVEMGHITEGTYGQQTLDALEAANGALSGIETKYKGTGMFIAETPEFKAVVNALKGMDAGGAPLIGTDSTKTLKGIRDSVKGKKAATPENGEDALMVKVTTVTPEIALQLIEKIVVAGQVAICLVHLADLFPKMNAEAQDSMIAAVLTLNARLVAHRQKSAESAVGIERAGVPDAAPQPGKTELQPA